MQNECERHCTTRFGLACPWRKGGWKGRAFAGDLGRRARAIALCMPKSALYSMHCACKRARGGCNWIAGTGMGAGDKGPGQPGLRLSPACSTIILSIKAFTGRRALYWGALPLVQRLPEVVGAQLCLVLVNCCPQRP